MNTNITYYNQNAQAFSESTFNVDMQPLYDEFLPLVQTKGHILDAGCGSARDAKAFKNLGFTVTAIDASSELVKIASEYLGQTVELKTYQQINDVNKFDGIWCCASLLHVPFNELNDVFNKLTTALKPNGVLYVSFKYGEPQTKVREHKGRHFTDLNEQSLTSLLTKHTQIQLNKTWITDDRRVGREGEQWLNAIIIKSSKKVNDVDGDFAYMDVGTRVTQEQLPEALQSENLLDNAPVGKTSVLQGSNKTQNQNKANK